MSNLVIVRSGSYFSDVRETRSACIDNRKPVFRYRLVGLRLGLDPAQPSRAIRGGTWFDNKSLARSAYRYFGNPKRRYSSTGLHLAMSIKL